MNEYFHSTFARDLAGLNGKGAEMIAKETVKYVEKMFYKGYIEVEGDGAMKWKSNGHYLPEDCARAVAFIRNDGNDTQHRMIANASVEATNEKRKAQDEETLKEYRESRKNHVLSDEERYEMACAFGKGTKVVDVITGQTFTV